MPARCESVGSDLAGQLVRGRTRSRTSEARACVENRRLVTTTPNYNAKLHITFVWQYGSYAVQLHARTSCRPADNKNKVVNPRPAGAPGFPCSAVGGGVEHPHSNSAPDLARHASGGARKES